MKTSIFNVGASLILVAFCFISCNKSSNEENSFKYLPVQIDAGDNWSIVDEEGNIVVDREYSSNDELSPISNNGAYWVYSNAGKTCQLYTIHSPKKPIVNTEFGQASCFINGISFVCDGVNPIQIINEEGKLIKTLSKDINLVTIPSNFNNTTTRIPFKDKTGKFGYLDLEGNISIPAKYYTATHFYDDFALAKQDSSSSEWNIIGTQEDIIYGKIDERKYEFNNDYIFSEGKIGVTEKASGSLIYLNKKGEIALSPSKTYKKGITFKNGRLYYQCGRDGFVFKDGFAVVVDKNDNVCVIDEQGECIIRSGKYSRINNLGKGYFAVERNDENTWEIVDKNDDLVLNEEFPIITNYKLGENFIVYDDGVYLRSINKKETKERKFHFTDFEVNNTVEYIDVEQIAKEFVQKIDSTGFIPFKGKTLPKDIASIYNLKPQEHLRYKKYIELPNDTINSYTTEISVNFNERPQVEKHHEEIISDGWFAYRKIVSDGWGWNNNAQIEDIYIEFKDIPFYVDENFKKNLQKKIGEELVKKGFIELDNGFEARNGNSYTVIDIVFSSSDKHIYISPNRNYSEINTDCCDIN